MIGSPCMGIVLFASTGLGNDLVDVVGGAGGICSQRDDTYEALHDLLS